MLKMVATSHMWLLKCKLINLTLSSSVTLATFQGVNILRWPVATELSSTDRGHFRHRSKFSWTPLPYLPSGISRPLLSQQRSAPSTLQKLQFLVSTWTSFNLQAHTQACAFRSVYSGVSESQQRGRRLC